LFGRTFPGVRGHLSHLFFGRQARASAAPPGGGAARRSCGARPGARVPLCRRGAVSPPAAVQTGRGCRRVPPPLRYRPDADVAAGPILHARGAHRLLRGARRPGAAPGAPGPAPRESDTRAGVFNTCVGVSNTCVGVSNTCAGVSGTRAGGAGAARDGRSDAQRRGRDPLGLSRSGAVRVASARTRWDAARPIGTG
jgi:hypothetical protein